VLVLTFIFGFTCGGIVLVLWVLFLLYRFLTHMEEKSSAAQDRKKKGEKHSQEAPSTRQLSCYVKLQTWTESSNGPNRLVPWTYAVLKENTIFVYSDSEKENLLHVILLDNCDVSVPNRNWASPQNAIVISHPEDYLLESTKKICIYYAIGRELEEWFWAVKTASELSIRSQEIAHELNSIRKHFSDLKGKLKPADGKETAAEAWANALLPRFWWNLFDNKSFKRFIVKRLGKRIAKITDFPKFIESMVLHSIDLGPSLPLVSNVSLSNLTSDGAVDVDMDLDYNGGFSMKILIKTSMSLPGTSLELPATAIINVNKLYGKLRLHVSPPPCERFWIGFHTLPDTDIQAETEIALLDNPTTALNMPKIATNIIKKLKADLTRVIVNKLKADIVGEKMVLPNMDDFPIPYFTHHEGEEDENYMSQVILSRETIRDEERKRRGSPAVLDISPAGVTILKKRIESDQIVPLLRSYASKDGVKRLTTTGVRTLQNSNIKENMEKGKQALIDSGMTNPKNWKDPLCSNLESMKGSVVDGLYQYGVKKAKKDMPPDFLPASTSKTPPMDKKLNLLQINRKKEKSNGEPSSPRSRTKQTKN